MRNQDVSNGRCSLFGGVKTKLSRRDFLAVGDESPMRNPGGVGGSAFLERRRNLALVLLIAGEKEHKLFHVLCPSLPNEEESFCALFFPKSVHSFSRWVVLGGRTPSAAQCTGACAGAVPTSRRSIPSPEHRSSERFYLFAFQ